MNEIKIRKNKLHKIFKNRFNHFRAGWRILFCSGMMLICFIPFAGLLKIWDLVTPNKGGSGGADELTSIVNIFFLIGLDLAVILGSWLTLRWIDKRPYTLLGIDFNSSATREFGKGFLWGCINFLAIFVVLKLSGLIEIKLSNVNYAMITGITRYFIVFTIAAIFEEAINRGYFFQALIEGTRTWIAVSCVALVFVIGHFSNTGFAWNNAVFFFVHGILYCTLYLLTRSVWVPVGFHLAWNWIQGSIFGMNVSGTEIKNTLFLCKSKGWDVLSGGEFGAEGSLISIFVSILFIIFLLKYKWLKPDAVRVRLWNKFPSGFGLEPIESDN